MVRETVAPSLQGPKDLADVYCALKLMRPDTYWVCGVVLRYYGSGDQKSEIEYTLYDEKLGLFSAPSLKEAAVKMERVLNGCPLPGDLRMAVDACDEERRLIGMARRDVKGGGR